MKITHTILALLAAGFLGHAAFASDTYGPLGLMIAQDGHGGQHIMFFQTGLLPATSLALYTDGGGVATPVAALQRIQPDNGDVKLVIGNDQHGQAHVAYIPQTSHFGPAGQ